MNDLRPLRRIGKTAACLLVAVIVFAISGQGLAQQATTKPAPLKFGLQPGSEGVDMTGLMWQMFSAALIVIVIGGLAIFVIKKLLPRIGRLQNRQITVLETAYLGSRKSVHLLQVGSMKLLVASSPQGIVRLDDVTRAFPEAYADVALRAGKDADADKPVD